MVDYESTADLRDRVRGHYAAAAKAATGAASCCEDCGCGPVDVAEPGTAGMFYTDAERRAPRAGRRPGLQPVRASVAASLKV